MMKMMADSRTWAVLAILCFALSALLRTLAPSVPEANHELLEFKQEVIDRGYMVQCLGKEGWHWECE